MKRARLELAYFSGYARLKQRQTGGAGVILRFERVRPRRLFGFQPHQAGEITPQFLDRMIRALKRWKYDLISMDEVCRRAVTLPRPNRFVSLTFDGGYNVSPRATPDGKGFVFVRRDGGRFMLGIQDFATRQVQLLTQGPLDESPSVAPNSRLIIYAAQQGGRGILAGISSDGRVKQRLVSPATDVREPAWGPLAR